MPDKKKISELDSASVLNNGDLVVISQDNGDDSYSSKKAEMTMLGTKLLNGIDYTTLLDTTSKKPIGAINELRDLIIGQLPVVTESGSLASFTTSLALPLVSLKANITATQSGTGTPSPSNPRPISGFSSVTLTQKDSEDTTVDTFTIDLGETIYGGVLDCKNGTTTITHIKETFKWSEGGAVADLGTYTRKMFISSTMANESLIQLCNVAPYAYNYSLDSLHFYCRAYTNDTRIYLFLDEDNLPSDFDEFEVIYGLATPITLSGLTPDNFTTIAGENNIFADSGDVELSFKQGIQEYIDEQIASVQALVL